jgi:hypothetical protein
LTMVHPAGGSVAASLLFQSTRMRPKQRYVAHQWVVHYASRCHAGAQATYPALVTSTRPLACGPLSVPLCDSSSRCALCCQPCGCATILTLSSWLHPQVKFSLLDRRPITGGLLQYCEQQGIKIFAYGPLGGGLLSDRHVQQPTTNFLGTPRQSTGLSLGMPP